MEREVTVMTMTVVGDTLAGLQQLTQVRWSETVKHAIRHVCHLELDTFWQTQPVQCCKSVRDVVVVMPVLHLGQLLLQLIARIYCSSVPFLHLTFVT